MYETGAIINTISIKRSVLKEEYSCQLVPSSINNPYKTILKSCYKNM